MFHLRTIAAFAFAALFSLFLLQPKAHADKNDLSLWRMCARSDEGRCMLDPLTMQRGSGVNRLLADNKKFKTFVEQFAGALAPKFHSPSDSLGWSGWNLGVEYSLNDIPGGQHWDDGLQGVERYERMNGNNKDKSAPNLLHTIQLHARKGLPFSTELGFTGTYLVDSRIFLMGFQFKASVVEALATGKKNFPKVPDIALRMNYERLFGTPDMDFNLFNWDLSISYTFGLGGFIRLTPYTGYSLVYAIADPKVQNPLACDCPDDVKVNGECPRNTNIACPATDNGSPLLVLDDQKAIVHRWFLGLQFVAAHFSFIPEIIVTSAEVYNYSFNIGADF